MAQFETNDGLNEMIKQIEKFANKDDVYSEMISAGQEIMKNAIESGASKHIKSGAMIKSLKCTKPMLDKSGTWVGRVKFIGTDGTHKTKAGKKYDITNWLKAFRIEHGTSKEPAQPFVRPAIVGCENLINETWEEIYERKLKDLQ